MKYIKKNNILKVLGKGTHKHTINAFDDIQIT